MCALKNIDREINPFPVYARMRERYPVYYDAQTHHWNVFRYEDVQRVLSDYEMFSSQFAGDPNDPSQPFAAAMITTDPPKHRELRSLVTQAFTPRAVEAMAPRITQIVHEQLDQVRGQETLDVIADLAVPLPVIVIAEMMGIPAADRGSFKKWSDQVVGLANVAGEFNYEAFADNSGAIMEMAGYFFQMIEQRKVNPGDDLISGLVHAEVDGRKLETIELLGFCLLLLVAGNETTTNLIGNAVLTFAEHPEEWRRLREDPSLLPGAIEEVLRYRSPVQSMFRVAKPGARLGATDLPEGARIVAWIGAANRDEAQFPTAQSFQMGRSPNRHLAFGQGIHFCLGAPLARLEARIALTEMLERMPTMELVPGVALERLPSTLVYGLKHLPVKL
jgi:cytochrome P450